MAAQVQKEGYDGYLIYKLLSTVIVQKDLKSMNILAPSSNHLVKLFLWVYFPFFLNEARQFLLNDSQKDMREEKEKKTHVQERTYASPEQKNQAKKQRQASEICVQGPHEL